MFEDDIIMMILREMYRNTSSPSNIITIRGESGRIIKLLATPIQENLDL